MDKTKIFIIVFSVIICSLLLGAIIFSIIDLTKKPKTNTTPTTGMVSKRPSEIHEGTKVDTERVRQVDEDLLHEGVNDSISKSYIPQKVYIVYEDNNEKMARSVKFDNPILQSMNVLDIGAIVEPMKNDKSYGLVVLHSDVNGQNKLAIISNYNTPRSSYRNIDLYDDSNRLISNMNKLTNVNTILFGLANGVVYYFNPIQDHWISTNVKGAKHISGTSIQTKLLVDNMLYDVTVSNGKIDLSNPVNVPIPSGFNRIYGPNDEIYADLNVSGKSFVTLPSGKSTLNNVSDISFVFDNNIVGTMVIQKDDKNFIKGKYLLGDHLLVGKRKVRTSDISDPSDISVKLT
jgi:hypothetical protein